MASAPWIFSSSIARRVIPPYLRSPSVRRQAFTLLEITLAIAILMMIVTGVTYSFRNQWKKETSRRNAQKILQVCWKARSYAWREGKEWRILWDAEKSVLEARPATFFEQGHMDADEPSSKKPLQRIKLSLDSKVKLVTEGAEDPEEFEPIRCLPNRRIQHTSFLVKGTEGKTWRIRTDWDGSPKMEEVKEDEPKRSNLYKLKRLLRNKDSPPIGKG